MTAGPLVVRWIASDGARVRAALAAAFDVELPAGGSIRLPGLRLEIAEHDGRPRSRASDRLDVVASDPQAAAAPNAADRELTGARLLALGWATVDLVRVAAAWDAAQWVAAPRDSLIGARALLGSPGAIFADAKGAGNLGDLVVPTLLLEPDTEGRLAAALARHGEGPAALYIGLPAAATARARARLGRLGVHVSAGPGPFGPGVAFAGLPASSPTLILVPAGGRG